VSFENVLKSLLIYGIIQHMAMQYQRDEHRVHLIVYHLIFCPKRRKSVLVGEVGRHCDQMIHKKCHEMGWDVLSLAVQPDHVHLFVRVFPTNSAADVVAAIKGYTSHELRNMYPDLRQRLPSLWTRSYFASSAGNVSAAIIEQYIAAQKGV
jgi:putative transposase